MSESKELYANKWLSMREVQGPGGPYYYSHNVSSGGKTVAMLPYDRMSQLFLIRSEVTPCWHPSIHMWSSITGGVENHHNVLVDVSRELKEEAGYSVDSTSSRIISLGECYSSKSSDTTNMLYAVNVTGLEQGEALGDGSECEKDASVFWKCSACLTDYTKDPLLPTMLMRMYIDGIIDRIDRDCMCDV